MKILNFRKSQTLKDENVLYLFKKQRRKTKTKPKMNEKKKKKKKKSILKRNK